MPSCVLHVSGPEFDVDAFLASSTFHPYAVVYKGTPRGSRGKLNDRSGFKIHVCDGDGVLAQQAVEALAFLRAHQAELARLTSWPNVASRHLDFGYWQREVVVQCEFLSPELLSLAGSLGIGIELSMYPHRDGQEESECHIRSRSQPT